MIVILSLDPVTNSMEFKVPNAGTGVKISQFIYFISYTLSIILDS